ncbi:MAG: M24 family metallopeptidase [Parvibaculaceae bacterium]
MTAIDATTEYQDVLSEPLLSPPEIDLKRMKDYRLGRLREQMEKHDVTLLVLTNPMSLRYAVDFRNYAMFQSRIPIYYLFVPLKGPIVIHGALHSDNELISEGRKAAYINFFNAGPNHAEEARRFANQIKEFLKEIGAEGGRIALEAVNPSATQALLQQGVDTIDAIPLIEYAKVIKSSDEINCIRYAVDVAQLGMSRIHKALRPGVTENALWSLLHQTNIMHDGEWFDGRALSSGQRTNPWYQDATAKQVNAGELVGFDTDMLGPYGYCADVSRTLFCYPGKPSAAQRELYRRAYDEVHANMELFRPGLSFLDVSRKAFQQPAKFKANRYTCLAHGVGLGDEYPKIFYQEDWITNRAYDGQIEPGMVLCVESYVGEVDGPEGVKLEQQILITDDGWELLSDYPFEDDLLKP